MCIRDRFVIVFPGPVVGGLIPAWESNLHSSGSLSEAGGLRTASLRLIEKCIFLYTFIFLQLIHKLGLDPCPKRNKNNKALEQGNPSYYYFTYESYSAGRIPTESEAYVE